MVDATSITVTEPQKKALIRFKSKLEANRGEEVTQGEAVKEAAEIAKNVVRSEGSDGRL